MVNTLKLNFKIKGCQEYIDPFVPNPPEWSAVRIRDYGYTEMTVHNNTHISIQQISSDRVSTQY